MATDDSRSIRNVAVRAFRSPGAMGISRKFRLCSIVSDGENLFLMVHAGQIAVIVGEFERRRALPLVGLHLCIFAFFLCF